MARPGATDLDVANDQEQPRSSPASGPRSQVPGAYVDTGSFNDMLKTHGRASSSLDDSGYGKSIRQTHPKEEDSVASPTQDLVRSDTSDAIDEASLDFRYRLEPECDAQYQYSVPVSNLDHDLLHIGCHGSILESTTNKQSLRAIEHSSCGRVGAATSPSAALYQKTEIFKTAKRKMQSSRFWEAVSRWPNYSTTLIGIGAQFDEVAGHDMLAVVGRIDTMSKMQFPFPPVLEDSDLLPRSNHPRRVRFSGVQEYLSSNGHHGIYKPSDEEADLIHQLCLQFSTLSLKEIKETLCTKVTGHPAQASTETSGAFDGLHTHEQRGISNLHNKGVKRKNKQKGREEEEEDGRDRDRKRGRTFQTQQDDDNGTYNLPCPFYLVNSIFFRAGKHSSQYQSCEKPYKNTDRLWGHLRCAHKLSKYLCPECYEPFRKVEYLAKHIEDASCSAIGGRDVVLGLWLVPGFAARDRLYNVRIRSRNISQIRRWCRIWKALFPTLRCPPAEIVSGLLPENFWHWHEFCEQYNMSHETESSSTTCQSNIQGRELAVLLNLAWSNGNTDLTPYVPFLNATTDFQMTCREQCLRELQNTHISGEVFVTSSPNHVDDEIALGRDSETEVDAGSSSRTTRVPWTNETGTLVNTQPDASLSDFAWLEKHDRSSMLPGNGVLRHHTQMVSQPVGAKQCIDLPPPAQCHITLSGTPENDFDA